MCKLEVYLSKGNDHRWRLKAANGEIVAISEGYNTRDAALDSAKKVKAWAASAQIVEIN